MKAAHSANIEVLMKYSTYFLAGIFLFNMLGIGSVLAHGDEAITSGIQLDPFFYIKIAAAWLVVLVIYAFIRNQRMASLEKKLIFWLIAVPIILASLYLAGYTVYENFTSETKGPVHWHADYQVWTCGEQLDLKNPTGLTNRIGSPSIHEHNDGRIHVEGTLSEIQEADLQHYFKAIGGYLDEGRISYPNSEKTISYNNGDKCSSGEIGTLKVYVNGKRIDNFEKYVLYPSSYVPPGDCIIIVFDSSDSGTTSLKCASWETEGWSYEKFHRRTITIGGKTWQ